MTSQRSPRISLLYLLQCASCCPHTCSQSFSITQHTTFSPELYLHLVSFHYTTLLSGRSTYNKFLFMKTETLFNLSSIPALTFTFKPFIALAPQYLLLSRSLTSFGHHPVSKLFMKPLLSKPYISTTNYTILTVIYSIQTSTSATDRMAPLVSGLFL